MKITNQKPAILSPIWDDNLKVDFDPTPVLQTMMQQLFQPLMPSVPVTMQDNKGHTVTNADIATWFAECLDTTYNSTAETIMKDVFGNTLADFNPKTTLSIRNVFAVQSGTAAKLPEPSDKIIYNPSTDIIPMSRKFLAGTATYDEYFATMAYYTRAESLGFYFCNEFAFDAFKTWFAGQMTMLSQICSSNVNQLAADFQNLSLSELTESLILRANDGDNNEPFSFARLLIKLLMQYTTVVSPAEFGILPFDAAELLCPKTVIFVNVEKHSKASARQVADEWKLIQSSMKQKPSVISMNKLYKMTATSRTLQKNAQRAAAAAAAANAGINSGLNIGGSPSRSKTYRFRKTPLKPVDITRYIKRLMEKMAFVNKSMNVYKCTKQSFARPNRRDPDDFNKKGIIVSTKYKPDIHLYVDTSGSISERNYQDAIKACIAMAKKLNVNLYFNSFSNSLSQTTLLHTKDKSRREIYKEFQSIPKVTGGTDYAQIWEFINCSKKRLKEISIIISDFEYTAPSRYIKHPKNLYYIPCSNMNWDDIMYEAKHFCESALHNEPNIRNHVLM